MRHTALEILGRALDLLPDDYREVFVLREYNGLSYIEIAEAVGVSLDTIKIRIFRAKKRLREILAPSLGEMFEDRVWADSDRALRNEIKRAGASAPCWVVLRDAQIVAIETGLGGWDSRVWPMLLRDA